MATSHGAGLLDRGKSIRPRQKAKLSQRVQELHATIDLQAKGRKTFTQSCEAKLSQKRELLPPLREAVRADVRALDIAQKVPAGLYQHSKLPLLEVCGAQKYSDMALARKTPEEAKEKLQAKIYEKVNQYNMLLDQLGQRSRAKEELQRQLQWLQDVTLDEKRQQAQLQVVRQLENDIAKMLTKVHDGQKVTSLYQVMRDVLRKELAHMPQHLDLLHGMAELYQGELAVKKPADLACARLPTASRHQFPPLPRLVGLQDHFPQDASSSWGADEHSSSETDSKAEAITSQLEHEAWLTAQMEKSKAAMQYSHLWDIPGRLLAQQGSSEDLELYYMEHWKEKQWVLKETLKELELKQAELKFHQCLNTDRAVEEELRMNLQREQARLEEMWAQMLRNQELLLKFENAINNLFYLITLPDQEETIKAETAEDKLQHCTQKLQYLVEQVADLPPDRQSPDKDNEGCVKLRDFFEKMTTNSPQNLKISSEDIDSGDQDPIDFDDDGHVLTREDIKRQGLQLIKSKKRSKK